MRKGIRRGIPPDNWLLFVEALRVEFENDPLTLKVLLKILDEFAVDYF